MKKDLFGFKSQGVHYDAFRPRYPKSQLLHALSKLKRKSKYLDIATGTGKILFELAPYFERTVGQDLSEKMIAVCRQKCSEPPYSKLNIEIEQGDFMERKAEEFDLITIGQALHWFPVSETLRKCRQMLSPEGALAIHSYVFKSVTTMSADHERDKELAKLFYEFYDMKVKRSFDFDRDELHTHYTDKQRYPFEEIFEQVERIQEEVKVQMNKQSFLAYLRTFSGYNTYLQKNSDDPILDLEKQILPDDKLWANFDYFAIYCKKKQK